MEQFIPLSATTTVRLMPYSFLNPSRFSFNVSESLMFPRKTSHADRDPVPIQEEPHLDDRCQLVLF